MEHPARGNINVCQPEEEKIDYSISVSLIFPHIMYYVHCSIDLTLNTRTFLSARPAREDLCAGPFAGWHDVEGTMVPQHSLRVGKTGYVLAHPSTPPLSKAFGNSSAFALCILSARVVDAASGFDRSADAMAGCGSQAG